jgi:hypothetical protein
MTSIQEIFLKHFEELISNGVELPPKGQFTNYDLRAKVVAWETRCLNLIEKAFGSNSDYYKNLKSSFCVDNYEIQRANGLAIMESAKVDYQSLYSPIESLEVEKKTTPLIFLKQLFSRFHLIARQLRERRDGRETLDINDEYDVQDLTHALLRINFDNIRKEEWTPSYACGSSRMDFLLKNEGIVVETKKTRLGLSTSDLANQLIVDIERYQAHPDCKMLFCFVYDPEGRIADPESLEELGKPHGNIDVIILVTPKGK